MERFVEINRLEKRTGRLQTLASRRAQAIDLRMERLNNATDPLSQFRHAHAIALNNQHLASIPQRIDAIREQQRAISSEGLAEYARQGLIPQAVFPQEAPAAEAVTVQTLQEPKTRQLRRRLAQKSIGESARPTHETTSGRKSETIKLPKGVTVETSGMNAQIIKVLKNKRLSIPELAIHFFGSEDAKKHYGTISATISNANRILRPVQYEIHQDKPRTGRKKGETGSYFVEKIKSRDYVTAASVELYDKELETLVFPDGQEVEKAGGIVTKFFKEIVKDGAWSTDLIRTYNDYKTNPNGAINRVYASIKALTVFVEKYGHTVKTTTEGKGKPKFYEIVPLGQPLTEQEVPRVEINENMLTLKEGARLAAFIRVNYDILRTLSGFEEMHNEFTKATSAMVTIEPVSKGGKEADEFTLRIIQKIQTILRENGGVDGCCELADKQLPESRELFEYVILMQDKNHEFLLVLEKILTKGVDSITIEDRFKDGSKTRYVESHYRKPNFTIPGANADSVETEAADKATVVAHPAPKSDRTKTQTEPESAATNTPIEIPAILPAAETVSKTPSSKPARLKKHGPEERFPEANHIIGEAIKTLLDHGIKFEDRIPAAQITNILGIRRTDQEQLEGRGLVKLTINRHSNAISLTFENAVRLAVFKKLKGETLNTTAAKMLEDLITDALDKARRKHS